MTTFNNKASYQEILQALGQRNDVPTLGEDLGSGQSCMFLQAGSCCHRLRLDLTGAENMLSALAVIVWKHQPDMPFRVTHLISNAMLEYETLRSFASLSEEAYQAKRLDTSWITLMQDLMLAIMGQYQGPVLYVPIPAECPEWLKSALLKDLEEAFNAMSRDPDKFPLIPLYSSVALAEGRFSLLYQDFKRSPDHWHEKTPDQQFDCRSLMMLYSTALMRRAFLINPELFYQLRSREAFPPARSDLADFLQKHLHFELSINIDQRKYFHFRMVAGCPAAQEWTAPDNASLYARDLGLSLKKLNLFFGETGEVHFRIIQPSLFKGPEIVPEPCAAILPHVTGNREERPCLNDGVAVYDSGALTNDICILYYGESRTYRFSCCCSSFGGHMIERNMLRILRQRAIQERAAQGRETLFDIEEDNALLMYLRTVKEAYFPACQTRRISITFHLEDGETHTQRFMVDEVIREALNLPYTADHESELEQGKSYLERAAAFLNTAVSLFRSETGLHDLRLGTLIITGGSSNVCELRQLLESTMFCVNKTNEADPSSSVGNGLALTISRQEIEDFRALISQGCSLDEETQTMKAELKQAVEQYLPDAVKAQADSYISSGKDCYMADFGDKVTNRLNHSTRFPKALNEALDHFIASSAGKIQTLANANLPRRFPGRIPMLQGEQQKKADYSSSITSNLVKTIMKTVDLRGLVNKVVTSLTRFLKKCFIAACLGSIPLIGPVLAALYLILTLDDSSSKAIQKKKAEAQKKKLTVRSLNAIKRAMNDTSKFQKSISDSVELAMEEVNLAGNMMNDLIAVTVNHVTMHHFDFDQTKADLM